MKEKFISDLKKLGIQSTDTIMVHSSYKSLGKADDLTPAAVAEALMAAVPDGTLLLPSLTYEAVTKTQPRFITSETPCCVGIIPETFRKMPGVVRSVHPTHSVCAYGKHAAELTSGHHLDRTPVGEHSPFRLLMNVKGKIVMLGCGLTPNTFIHGMEEYIGVPYVLSKDKTRFEIVYESGRMEEAHHTTHDFKGTEQRYERVKGLLTIKTGKVLEAEVYVTDAAALWETVADRLRKDPLYFVDKV